MDTPNIVWLSLESFRADHTSLHGYDRETTPNLERLATRSGWQTHDRCFSHGIWTRSSTASILTGTYPSHHRTGFDAGRLPAELRTVPELLGEVGYETACVSPNPHIHGSTDLDRGFDAFTYLDMETVVRRYGPGLLLNYLVRLPWHGDVLSLDKRRQCFGYLMNEMAKETLRRRDSDAPQFLYVHHPDSHHPYCPPRPYQNQFAGYHEMNSSEAITMSLDVSERMNEYMAAGVPLNEGETRALTAMYDAGLAYVDSLVGDLVADIRDILAGETIFVISGDHGEFLGEHSLLAHRISTDTIVSHVPLLVFGLDADLGESPVVQHVDVMQTILASVGADTGQFQGVDLHTGTRNYALTQRGHGRTTRTLDQLIDINPSFDRSRYAESDVTSVQTRDYRYAKRESDSQLFRIAAGGIDEPVEDPDQKAELDEFVTEWLRGPGQPITDEQARAEIKGATADRLKELGYLVD